MLGIARESVGRVRVCGSADEVSEGAALVLILRDQPDAFRGAADRLRERLPTAEVLIVDSLWGVSARRTRPEEPAGWTVDEAAAVRRLQAVLDADDGRPEPWTLTFGERAAAVPPPAEDWPWVKAAS